MSQRARIRNRRDQESRHAVVFGAAARAGFLLLGWRCVGGPVGGGTRPFARGGGGGVGGAEEGGGGAGEEERAGGASGGRDGGGRGDGGGGGGGPDWGEGGGGSEAEENIPVHIGDGVGEGVSERDGGAAGESGTGSPDIGGGGVRGGDPGRVPLGGEGSKEIWRRGAAEGPLGCSPRGGDRNGRRAGGAVEPGGEGARGSFAGVGGGRRRGGGERVDRPGGLQRERGADGRSDGPKILGVLPEVVGTGGESRAREGGWRGRGGVEPAGSGYTLPKERRGVLQTKRGGGRRGDGTEVLRGLPIVVGTGGDGRAGIVAVKVGNVGKEVEQQGV